ncbi:MAG: ABC transporter ATP-binding protein [Rhizobiaceae bacterium]
MQNGTAAAGNILELQSITKRFNGLAAVEDLSLDVAAGEFLSLLGPSGCGKTTTLRLIAGFEHADEGRIMLQGKDIARFAPNQRDVNTVFQHYALFPHLDVAQNIGYGMRIKGVAKAEITRRVGEILEVVQMNGFEQRFPHQLSGGQQQRIALARALVNRPSVLLLDEPLGALDLQVRKKMQIELKKIQREVGITFVYVTHDQEEALTLSDRIVVMNRARIEQIGTARDVYEAPSSPFVLNFVGSSNWFTGRASRKRDGIASVEIAPGLAVAARSLSDPGPSGGIGIRPENISLAAKEGGDNSFEGRVVDTIFQGAHALTEVELAPDVVLTLMTPASAEIPSRGQSVWVSWAAEDAIYFDV